MVCTSSELLKELIKIFDGQKICVVGADDRHNIFLQELNKKVHLVQSSANLKSESIVGVLNFGSDIKTNKKVINIAADFSDVAIRQDCIVCHDFLHLNKQQTEKISAIISDYTLSGFNYFCGRIFEVNSDKSACDYFKCLNKILILAERGDVYNLCLLLNALKATQFVKNLKSETVLEQNASAYLSISLCEFFLEHKPFVSIFKRKTLSQAFGVWHSFLGLDAQEVCYKLNEFCGELSFMCALAKESAQSALRVYKRTKSDAGFRELKNLNRERLIKNMLHSSTQEGFNLIKVMQFLGLV